MDPMQIGLKIFLFVCPLVLDAILPCKCERSLVAKTKKVKVKSLELFLEESNSCATLPRIQKRLQAKKKRQTFDLGTMFFLPN